MSGYDQEELKIFLVLWRAISILFVRFLDVTMGVESAPVQCTPGTLA
jgi:hypothetical protein